jgi:hypothetical protein
MTAGRKRADPLAESCREAYFHNENPESVDKALALYAPNIVREAPFRGPVYTDPRDVKDTYMAIFRTVDYNKDDDAAAKRNRELRVRRSGSPI